MLNILFKIISLFRNSYWFAFKPITIGVKIIAVSDDKVLLVKNRYDKFWCFPGGGIKTGETLAEAAKREMMEECKIEIEEIKVIGAYSNFVEYKSDHIVLFSCDVSSFIPNKKGYEIEKMEFFKMNNLPIETSPATRRRLEEFISNKNNITSGKW